MSITGGAPKKRKSPTRKTTTKKKTARKTVKKTVKKAAHKDMTVEQLKKKAKHLGIPLSKDGVAKNKAALKRAIASKSR